jgi:alpha-glucosidase (family GH31 glycosyl hydrolase)
MKKLFLKLWLLLAGAWAGGFSCAPQQKPYTFDGSTLAVQADSGTYYIQAFSEQVVKVRFERAGMAPESPSHAVVMAPKAGIASLAETDSAVELYTASLRVRVRLQPFGLEFVSKGEAQLQGGQAFVGEGKRGFRFRLAQGEQLYGAGERALPLNIRGRRLDLYNSPRYDYEWGADRLNYSLPVLTSSRRYLLFFDNPQAGVFDLGKTDPGMLEWSAMGGDMTFYFVSDDTFYGLSEHYTALTGRQELPPRWAMGYLLSRFGYKTQAEAVSVFDRMWKAGYPVDAVILDLFWFGDAVQGTMGNLDWHAPNWPDPKAMIGHFKEKQAQTILITEPFILKGTPHFDDAVAKGALALDEQGQAFVDTNFYFGDAGLVDIFKPEAQDWFWPFYQKQAALGVGGWWGDLGEPESHPSGMRHAIGKADEVHNIYGHYWIKMLHDRYAANYPETRLFNLSRAGFAGTQRYSVFPWTGDVGRSWNGLKAQVPMMLSMGMSGIGYAHSDLGGFTPRQGMDEELYLRWLQMGLFSPIFRPHSSEYPSEPIFYSKKAQGVVRELVKMRYRMAAYNYTLAWQNASKGLPLARPTFFEHPDDPVLLGDHSLYYWGSELLVVPVLQPGLSEMTIRLPKGKWFGFWDDARYEGGELIQVPVPEGQVPVFAKAGALVPLVDFEGNMAAYSSKRLELHYYADPTAPASEAVVYEDDGVTRLADRGGKFVLLQCSAGWSGGKPRLQLSQQGEGYEGAPEQREVVWAIHGLEAAPAGATAAGSALPVEWDDKAKVARIRFSWNGVPMEVQVQ